MYKKFITSIVLVFSLMVLSGCNESITYSNEFEGIPIYPKIDLVNSTEDKESYEKINFKDTFQEVKEFYMENIDEDRWEIEKKSLYPGLEDESYKSQGYMLKGKEQEVSLIMELQKTENKGNILYITLNGSPFDEDRYSIEGKSEHWEASLEYVIRKEGIFIDGDVLYTGYNPPKEVDNKFVIYQIKEDSSPEENMTFESSSQETKGKELKNSRFNISSQSNREYKLEIYKKAINYGYIEIKWKEQGKDKIEKINIKIVE